MKSRGDKHQGKPREKTLEKPPWISIIDQKVSLAHPEHFQIFFTEFLSFSIIT